MVAILGLMLGFALLPQNEAQAKTCYDSSKNPIPCPQSNYVMTQQAKKAAGPSSTPVPPTDTPTQTPSPTPTNTPLPPASDTPQATALVVQPAASAFPNPPAGGAPGPVTTPPGNALGSLLFPWIMGGAGFLAGILVGLLIPAVLKQFGRAKPQTNATIYGDALVKDYTYPELNSKDHDKLEEKVSDRPEKHEIQ